MGGASVMMDFLILFFPRHLIFFDPVDACLPSGVIVAIAGWGDADDFAEGVGKMAVAGEAEIKGDLGDRTSAVAQQSFGPVDPPFGDVATGWFSECHLEGTAEMMTAEVRATSF
jgi:hypothetical protein